MDSIADLFATPAARVAVVSVLAAAAVELVKSWAPALAASKWLTRALAVVVVAFGAAAADWCPDGVLTVQSWLGYAATSLMGAELSYQWALKALAKWAQSGDTRARTGMGVDG